MTSGKAARRLRKASVVAALVGQGGVEPDLAEHMYDNQIAPEVDAAELRAQGFDVQTVFVRVGVSDADGVEVSCVGCGKTARMPMAPPPDRQVMCPPCQRRYLKRQGLL